MRRAWWGTLTALAVAGALAGGAAPGRAGSGATGTSAGAPVTRGFFGPPSERAVARAQATLARAQQEGHAEFHEFHFTRGMYTDWIGPRSSPFLGDGGPKWSVDFPKGDRQFMTVVRRLSSVDASERENPVALDDPDLRRFPFLFMLEMGYADLTDEEVKGLRDYLNAGGFLVVDDFWGSREWDRFAQQMRRVLPGRPIVEIPRDHLIFRILYNITGEIIQVPNLGYAYAIQAGIPNPPTSEKDGFVPHVRGIFDDKGRLMVAINWNTDLGDAWEHAENAYYPLKFSTFAFEIGLNMIIYGMTQ